MAPDFLFIHAEAGASPFRSPIFFPPTGVIALSSYLNANGFRTRVIDSRHPEFTIGWLAQYLEEEKPAWVGISVLSDSLFQGTRLTDIVRISSPSSRVAIGGAHATMNAREVLEELEPDVVVRGEGELPCADLLTKSNLEDVRGITFKRNGKTIDTAPPPPIDLDSLPSPDFDVVIGHEAMRYSPAVVTGRGCPYKCTFCAASTLSPTVRWRSIKKVIEDIEFARGKCEGKFLAIFDDTFTLDAKRTRKFCKAVRKIGGGKDLFWFCEGRVDRLSNDLRLLPKMRKAGLRFLQLGIESGDQRVLDSYKKGIRLADAEKLCRACAKHELLTHTGFIAGGPFESHETLDRTRSVAMRLAEMGQGYLQAAFTFLNPLPGTEIFAEHERYDLRLLDPHLLSSTFFDNAVTATSHLSREEIFRQKQRIVSDVNMAIYNVFRSKDEEYYSVLRKMLGEVGVLIHSTLKHIQMLDSGSSWDGSEIISITRAMYDAAGRYSQFRYSAKDSWREAIPARLPFFTMGDEDRYELLTGEKLSADESDVLHYSSGKLTGGEIAVILDDDGTRICPALESLEDKKAIVYRSF
jgi:anaerobic magnesium-protoporphyrin IX monomethyl ester cyclase